MIDPSHHRALRLSLTLCLLLSVSACGGSNRETFDLGPVPVEPAARALRGALSVEQPQASELIDSERIVIRTGPDAVAYLKGAQWADRVPVLVQSRLIQSFENAHLLKSVGRPGMVADYALGSEIRRFEIDVTTKTATVEIAARLRKTANGRVIAAQIFTETVAAPSTSGDAASQVIDSALTSVMGRILRWTTTQI